jgi:hypothetical protein
MAAAATPEASRTAAKVTSAEFVRSLPADFKMQVLRELLSELAQSNLDNDSVDVEDADGQFLATVAFAHSAAVAADRMYADLDARTRMELMKSFLEFDWDDCLSDAEVDAIMKGEESPQTR